MDKNIVQELCEGLSEETQIKIKSAYWQGCCDGLDAAKSPEHKIDFQQDNVVFLKDRS